MAPDGVEVMYCSVENEAVKSIAPDRFYYVPRKLKTGASLPSMSVG